ASTRLFRVPGNRERGVLRCPSAWVPERFIGDWGSNYGYNGEGIEVRTLPPNSLGLGRKIMSDGRDYTVVHVPASEVVAPHNMIAFGDGAYRIDRKRLDFGWGNFGRGLDYEAGLSFPTLVKNGNRIAKERHNDRWNLAFFDGHAEAQKLQTVFFYERV